MAENLFPEETLEITAEELGEREYSPVGYMPSVYFDDKNGDFVRDGQYRLKSATGVEAWEQWCVNCIMTERGAFPAYGSIFGISTVAAFKADTHEEAESILTLEITEGLMNDPYGRTESIEDITFEWNGDELNVHVIANGINDVTIDFEATIDRKVR